MYIHNILYGLEIVYLASNADDPKQRMLSYVEGLNAIIGTRFWVVY